jgi:hypothetical protein
MQNTGLASADQRLGQRRDRELLRLQVNEEAAVGQGDVHFGSYGANLSIVSLREHRLPFVYNNNHESYLTRYIHIQFCTQYPNVSYLNSR